MLIGKVERLDAGHIFFNHLLHLESQLIPSILSANSVSS